jgi:isoleucyl-tRNA synthetase
MFGFQRGRFWGVPLYMYSQKDPLHDIAEILIKLALNTNQSKSKG